MEQGDKEIRKQSGQATQTQITIPGDKIQKKPHNTGEHWRNYYKRPRHSK